uniref:DNA-directed DNA polymerase n=1 Tax=Macrostomum lignano TaxID=282301 RepID=A0A1I8GXM3_9PLAT
YDEAGSHLCFVKAPKVKASTMPYVFYDTETYTDDEKQHHVHLVTAVTCCETCSGRAFPRETCRLCNGLHSAANCLTGRDLGKEFSNCPLRLRLPNGRFCGCGPGLAECFFTWLSTTFRGGAIVVAHNASGYDAFLLLGALLNGLAKKRPQVLFQGSRLMSMTICTFRCCRTECKRSSFLGFAAPVWSSSAAAATTQTRQRALTGTWATPELQKAFQLGYRLQAVHALAYWTEKRTGLFSDYAESSGSPGMSDEDKAAYIADFFAKEGVTLDKVEPNPGLRFVAKIFLNSLWGKFCQRDDLTSTEIVSSYEDWLARLTDPNLKDAAGVRSQVLKCKGIRLTPEIRERSDDLRNALLHGGSLQLPQFQFRRDKASCTIHTISMDKTFQRVLTK